MNLISLKDLKKGNHYDFLLVGAGLFNAVCAKELTSKGFSCLVIDKRNHIGGNCYTSFNDVANCYEHVYGAHIFHTNNSEIWNYVNNIVVFDNFINQPIANYKGKIYNLPFNMNTFSKIFDVASPKEAIDRINKEIEQSKIKNPKNLEEQALNCVGKTIYKTLIKEYTEKQWGRSCKELPPEIIKRVPLRFSYDNNYFNDTYQGIPKFGYTDFIEKMFNKCDVLLNVGLRYLFSILGENEMNKKFFNIIYTGRIDDFFDYELGELDYRNLKFETEIVNESNYQGNAVVNYTSNDVKYTRIIEHKFFNKNAINDKNNFSLITKEYPCGSDKYGEACYPINDKKNTDLYEKYRVLARELELEGIYIEGRLGRYGYYDMDDTIDNALKFVRKNWTRSVL